MRRTLLVSVNGTGSPGPLDWGFDSEIGFNVTNPWFNINTQLWGPYAQIIDWGPVGYPAATLQMGASTQTGVVNGMAMVNNPAYADHNIILTGYSQGAMVTDFMWRDHLMGTRRGDDVIGIVNFGDPMRAPGICNGNVHAGFPVPKPLDGFTTGGIAGPGDLTRAQTPDFLMSCNNDADLYGSAPVGDNPWTAESAVGHDETMMFNLIQNFLDLGNLEALIVEAMGDFGMALSGLDLMSLIGIVTGVIGGVIGGSTSLSQIIPSTGVSAPSHVVALVLALLNGGMFVASGMGPHGDYEKMVPAMTDWVLETAYAHAG